jgi:predicted phosphodiesterase
LQRIAVIADIHADYPALESVGRAITEAGVDGIWCLGDWCSGGPQPRECFDWVTANCELILNGNHEVFVLARVWKRSAELWAKAAELAFTELGEDRVEQLYSYDAHAIRPDAELVHASLVRPLDDDFLLSPLQAKRNLELLDRPLLLFGHTHLPALWERSLTDGARKLRIKVGEDYELQLGQSPDDRRLLNPGAVCDGAGARWLLLEFDADGESARASWRRTSVAGHGGRFSVLPTDAS